MKKILIISYFFPPCNLTASNRVYSWATHLSKFNYYPIIVTRNWTGVGADEKSRLKSTSNKTVIDKHENYEVHYLPYKNNLRDYFFVNDYKLISKIFSFLQITLQNIFIKGIPFSNLFTYSRKILNENEKIKTVLISGNPFEQFFFGYKLKKEFPTINWVADYRDEWTTRIIGIRGFHLFLNQNYHSFFEKKWISNAAFFIAAAPAYVATIQKLTKKKGYVIYNGFDENIFTDDLNANIEKENDTPLLCYLGTIYPEQDFKGMINILEKLEKKVTIQIIGDTYVHQTPLKYVQLECVSRMPYKDSIMLTAKASILLLPTYIGDSGIIPSKIFDYIALKKPVWVFPEGNSEIEQILSSTNQLLNMNQLIDIIENKKKTVNFGLKNYTQYSRLMQTEKLALLLDTL